MTDRTHSTFGYDFGDDDEVRLPDDPNFDAWISSQAAQVNSPTATPRVEMWDAIQAKQNASIAAQAGSIPGVMPMRRRGWILPAAIAAALLAGIGVDRLLLRDSGAVNGTRVAVAPPAVTATPDSAASADPARLYRVVAIQTLSQAEALLTAYRSSNVAERNPEAAGRLGKWGRDVLSSTRLLLDSPAGDDAELRPLLDDLELVLVQIIRLSGAPLDASERALIDRAMREHDLLPRIRSAVPAGFADAAASE